MNLNRINPSILIALVGILFTCALYFSPRGEERLEEFEFEFEGRVNLLDSNMIWNGHEFVDRKTLPDTVKVGKLGDIAP